MSTNENNTPHSFIELITIIFILKYACITDGIRNGKHNRS